MSEVEVGDRVWITNEPAGGWTQIRGRVIDVNERAAHVDISPFICGGVDRQWFAFEHLFATMEDAHPGEPYSHWTPHCPAEEWEQVQEKHWAEVDHE